MQKSINFHKRQKVLNSLIIASFLVLAILVIPLETASGKGLESSNTLEMSSDTEHIPSRTFDETDGARNLRISSTLHENTGLFKKIRPYLDIYTFGGIVTALLTVYIYPRIVQRESKLTKYSPKKLYSLKIFGITRTEWESQEDFELRKRRIFTAIPVLCITFAEILIFLGDVKIAVVVHIGGLIGLSLSNIYVNDPEIQKIHQALMLLPILRLINFSMPIFFDTTLYTFIFIYGTLTIPVAFLIIHQKHTLEQIGFSMKNIWIYMVLSVPLSFILGLGEYLTIKPEYIIPDLTFENLLKLTIIMVFFVGLIEELIFRSILQTRLAQALSISESLLITSLLFGLMHSGYGTCYEILYTSFVGFLIGLIFYKTKSLPFITVLHGFINVFLFGIIPHYMGGWAGL